MSIAVVKNQINTFLATEKPEVIAIKGAWGVGKTYSWKQFLLAAKGAGAELVAHTVAGDHRPGDARHL